jgi:phosphopantetheine--protein transferase-like protein
MILGVGVDIEHHNRFKKYALKDNPQNLSLFYTNHELDNYKKLNTHLCYAISFSAKEALFKAFSSGFESNDFFLTDSQIFFNNSTISDISISPSEALLKVIKQYKIVWPVEYNLSIDNKTVRFEVLIQCKKK